MELTVRLRSQNFQEAIREVGINPNYWYPVSWATDLKSGTIQPIVIWKQAIALYRDMAGQVHAMDNACAHKGIELHQGEVRGSHLVCPYHGWEFNSEGQCVKIPYFTKGQKLPCATIRTYPVREAYGIIWLFPGCPELVSETPFPYVPEYDNPSFLVIPITGKFHAHFSICNENTMDVFHGFLHRRLNGWFDPVLLSLKEDRESVYAEYQVSYRGWLTQFLNFSENHHTVTTRTISLRYCYPHYHSFLEGVSSIHLMRLPVGPSETRSFSLLFVRLRLPQWLQSLLKPVITPIIRRFIFMPFLSQDVQMIESEQRTYIRSPNQRYVEVNPAIIALQRLIVRQYEQYVQQSCQTTSEGKRELQAKGSTELSGGTEQVA